MSSFYKAVFLFSFFLINHGAFAQQLLKGRIIDASTKEPIAGASIHCAASGCSCGCASGTSGEFNLAPKQHCCTSFVVSCVGYQSVIVAPGDPMAEISLQQNSSVIQEVVVTASRERTRRSLAPVAITNISSRVIQDAKPTGIDQVLNKVSGVYMVNLGNEQHSMSIRQPMTTKSLFLYLEDGIPIRTTGLFNHNALLEINMASVRNIEVIKGPSSSLYGSEAIGGVVNFVTLAPSAVPVMKASLQGNNIGYKRVDLQTGLSVGKWGFALSGYYAGKRNGFIQYTDFHKANFTARADYHFNDRTTLINSLTMLDYYSDMTGGIDSTMFADHSFGSNQTFTYRKVSTVRYRSTLTHSWNDGNTTTASVIYRNNRIGQDPAYGIKDDYRRLSGGTWTGKKDLAHGEINEAGFNSYALILQHRKNFSWKKAVIIGGVNIDISPSTYTAEYIRIHKDTISGKYAGFSKQDSMLTNYKCGINNYAAFANVEFSPMEKFRVVASLRYDLFHYAFNNHLLPSSYSGSRDTANDFSRISPKIGFTYNFNPAAGLYVNYSEGFVPPQVTEMYRGVKVPELKPAVFYNYEAGGWAELIKGMLSTDLSIYRMEGRNEVVSVKMDDGSFQNMNAGRTMHKGIELGVNISPVKTISVRISAAYSKHQFVQFVEKGTSYSGNEMSAAPRWMHNAELWYKPSFAKGLRVGLEWQKLGHYFMDPVNTVTYKGYDVLHLRVGYRWKAMEIWMNVMNLADNYYAYTGSKSNSGYSYTPAEPRNFNVGISYDFGSMFKNDKK